MDNETYHHIQQIAELVQVTPDGTLSRTVYSDKQIKAVLFAFDTGQELSEHTASMPAIIHIVQGDGRLTLGGDTYDVQPGSWTHMPAGLSHSVLAKTPLIMLLLLLKNQDK